ncbi:MAG: hypothetical protein KC656_05715 [Myxococcales bacterium]|nr:hypothetical protein [Myxococcales bacterium]
MVYDLDRVVERSGVENVSMSHPLRNGNVHGARGGLLPDLAGPLGPTLIERLTDPTAGIVLDAWLDNAGNPRGDAALYLP